MIIKIKKMLAIFLCIVVTTMTLWHTPDMLGGMCDVQAEEYQGNPDDPQSVERRDSFLKEVGESNRTYAMKRNGNATQGIDVSYHQGDINWAAVKNAGVDFAIIRCGYRGQETRALYEDSKFRTNVVNAANAGIKVGIYFYSVAQNDAQAIEEANYVLNLISGYHITFPVYYDIEDSRQMGLSNEQRTSMCRAFGETIRNGGYIPGVYTYYNFAQTKLNMSQLSDYSIWIARYNSSLGYDGKCDMWQYTSDGSVPGINGRVDMNYCFTSYGSSDGVIYRTHVQDVGWEGAWRANGQMSGTSGQSKRLEAIQISLNNLPISGGVQYRTHIQDIGWETSWRANGQVSGTSGQSKRLEAIQIQLTGEISNYYDIFYRVHAQNFGWLDWAKNGQMAGTAGYSYRLEGIEVLLVQKGAAAPGNVAIPYRQEYIQYQTHVQDYGWQGCVADGAMSGTSGQSKRLEGICILLKNQLYGGGVQYRTHIQDIGWESSWRGNGQMSGTSGQSKRLEAIQIQLTGDMANYYDIYYQVHAQNYGWLGWAANGAPAGTEGHSLRLEGIKIVLVPKGAAAPGSTANAFVR